MKSIIKLSPKLLLLAFSMLFLAAACSDSESSGTNDEETSDDTSSEDVSLEDSESAVEPASLDLDLFVDGAFDGEPSEVECELSDGSQSTCYEITITGYPADHETGPFCPETITTGAEDAGVWIIEGDAVYDADGEFIESLADLYNDENWKMYDEEGNVFINDEEGFALVANPQPSEELANYCVEGKLEYLEGGEPIPSTFLIPTTPVVADETSSGGQWGVTLNGITIDPSAPVDLITGNYNVAPFDDCGGHYNPDTGYHMHAALDCSTVDIDGHEGMFGYALDGFAIFSYDEEIVGDLDECNGHTDGDIGYHYHASAPQDNSVLKCWVGAVEASSAQTAGGPPGGGPGGDGPPDGGSPAG